MAYRVGRLSVSSDGWKHRLKLVRVLVSKFYGHILVVAFFVMMSFFGHYQYRYSKSIENKRVKMTERCLKSGKRTFAHAILH